METFWPLDLHIGLMSLVSTLPIRNGNDIGIYRFQYILNGRSVRKYLTYKEWKRYQLQYQCLPLRHRKYLTYKEWKPRIRVYR